MIEMIEDDELRELFRIESEEHIQIIEKGLLELEKIQRIMQHYIWYSAKLTVWKGRVEC